MSEDLGAPLGVGHLLIPSLEQAPKGSGTWSVWKSFSISRRLPPLVAMGMVIFIITPWMGNKPKFWICDQREEESVRPAAAAVEGSGG